MKKRILAMLLCLAMAMQMTGYVGADDGEDLVWEIGVGEEEPVSEEAPAEEPESDEAEEITIAEEIDEEEIVFDEIIATVEDAEADADAEEVTEDEAAVEEIEIIEVEEWEFDSIELEAETFWNDGVSVYDELYGKVENLTSTELEGKTEDELWNLEVAGDGILTEIDAAYDAGDISYEQWYELMEAISTFMLAVLDTAPVAYSGNTTSEIILEKTAISISEDGRTGEITLSSYVTGTAKSTPTDVVLVIDNSGSMWTAVDPDTLYEFAELNTEKGKRRGYYVAFSREVDSKGKGIAYLMKYESGKWISDGSFTVVTLKDGEFYGSIDSVASGGTGITFNQNSDANYYFAQSISGALYDALNVFIEEMANAQNCRIAIVTFGGKVAGNDSRVHGIIEHTQLEKGTDYKGSGIFIDGELMWDSTDLRHPDSYFTKYKNGTYVIDKNKYSQAFENPADNSQRQDLMESVSAISTNYGNTPTALGLLYARRLFQQAGRTDANRVAIVFTDGRPSPDEIRPRLADSCEHRANANTTLEQAKEITADCPYCDILATSGTTYTYQYYSTYIDQAKRLKDGDKATVYSFGPATRDVGNDVLLNIASSEEHFKNVADSEELSKTFHEIAGYIVASSQELNEESVVKDIISASFQIPDNVDKRDIEVYTQKYTGKDSNGNDTFDSECIPFSDAKISVDIDTKTVEVSGFKYDENVVTMEGNTPVGSRLLIKIPIETEEDFLGGDGVSTNADSSGIYNGAVCVKEFVSPTINVTVSKITPKFSEQHIYISQTVDFPKILDPGSYEQNGELYEINGINNAYVNLIYVITNKPMVPETDSNGESIVDKEGNPVYKLDDSAEAITYTISKGQLVDDVAEYLTGNLKAIQLTEDTKFYIYCLVVSADDETMTNMTGALEDTTVWVYKPEITFKDSKINLGTSADYEMQNYDTPNVVWKHGEVLNTEDKLLNGSAPTLIYRYSIEEAAFTTDTSVQVAVEAQKDTNNNIPDNMDITQYTTFYREVCDFTGCDMKNATEKQLVRSPEDTASIWVNFIVHINSFKLKIVKKAADGTEFEPGETFLFTVKKDDVVIAEVMIVGDGNITLTGLPIGTYTVTENTEWSWRYECTQCLVNEVERTNNTVNAPEDDLDKDGMVEIVFTNELVENQWLDGSAYCTNVFNADLVESQKYPIFDD